MYNSTWAVSITHLGEEEQGHLATHSWALIFCSGWLRNLKQGVNIEGDQESVEQVVSDDLIEGRHIETEDVIDVVEMVKVFCYQFLQTTAIEMAGTKKDISIGMQLYSYNDTYM